MPPVPTPIAVPAQRADSNPLVAPAEHPQTVEASIITLPPDTFEQDLAETQNLLEEIFAHWNTMLHASEQSGTESDNWNKQVSEILDHISFNGEP